MSSHFVLYIPQEFVTVPRTVYRVVLLENTMILVPVSLVHKDTSKYQLFIHLLKVLFLLALIKPEAQKPDQNHP